MTDSVAESFSSTTMSTDTTVEFLTSSFTDSQSSGNTGAFSESTHLTTEMPTGTFTGFDTTDTEVDVCELLDLGDVAPGDPLCREDFSPEKGHYSPCLSSMDAEQCEAAGGVCFILGTMEDPDKVFCSILGCEHDWDCPACPSCGAKPKCNGPWMDPETGLDVNLCALGCEVGEEYRCPGNPDLDPSRLTCSLVSGFFERDDDGEIFSGICAYFASVVGEGHGLIAEGEETSTIVYKAAEAGFRMTRVPNNQ